MTILVAFADLTYTEKGISSNAFPYAGAVVSSYAKKKLKDEIEVELFKYPSDFKNYLESREPKIVCFTNYTWTMEISYQFAKNIKIKYPKAVTIFGGPNYPNETHTQKSFLLSYPAIDFYVKGEGETAFLNLYENLKKYNFDPNILKSQKLNIGNCHYIHNEELFVGETLPRVEELDDIPSPYLTGMFDKFFDKYLVPTIQTSRGCPFKCSFCQEGKDYFTRICKYSIDRVKADLEYISKKAIVPNLYIVDSNFGMYKQDIEISKAIAEIQNKTGWPKFVETALGKSKKVMEVIKILEGSLQGEVAIQSTDKEVLDQVKRKNVPDQTQIEVMNHADATVGTSFSEVILCLPGDTLDKHIKSMCDMIDKGFSTVRSHQLLLLPDSEMYSEEYRKKCNMETRFRLQPKCLQEFQLYDNKFPCAEIDEVCVSNETMPYEDYLKGRVFDLSVEIFFNSGIFREYVNLLNQYSIKASALIKKINSNISNSSLKEFYESFVKDNEESLWNDKSELEKYIKGQDVVKKINDENLRINEQLTYRAMAFFYKMEDLHNIVLESTISLLNEISAINDENENYLKQLTKFSLLRKNNLLSQEKTLREKFNYDFTKISKSNFSGSPFLHFKREPVNINFFHSSEQQKIFSSYIEQFGKSKQNLGYMLSRSMVNTFYRNTVIDNN